MPDMLFGLGMCPCFSLSPRQSSELLNLTENVTVDEPDLAAVNPFSLQKQWV